MHGYEQDEELDPLLFGGGGGRWLHLVERSCVTDVSERLAGSVVGVWVSSLGMNLGYMGRWALRPRKGETEMRMLLHYESIASLPYSLRL
jgi:hypothetical protein